MRTTSRTVAVSKPRQTTITVDPGLRTGIHHDTMEAVGALTRIVHGVESLGVVGIGNVEIDGSWKGPMCAVQVMRPTW
jgi:hypothetical protein